MCPRKDSPRAIFNFVSPEGFEPPTTVPKTVMISVSPQGQKCGVKTLTLLAPHRNEVSGAWVHYATGAILKTFNFFYFTKPIEKKQILK